MRYGFGRSRRPSQRRLNSGTSLACVGNIAEVNLHLVHADAAHDGRSPAFHQHLSQTGKLPGKPIVITEGHNTGFGAALRGESPVIAQRISWSEFLDAGNAAGEPH